MSKTSPKTHFVISGGSLGGNYNSTSSCLCSSLNKHFESRSEGKILSFRCIVSNGSNENMKNLNSGFADFALTQRNVLLSNLYDEKSGIKNIQVLIPLFEEQFLIYLKSGQSISIDSLRSRIKNVNGNKFRIGVTNVEGYSYESFLQVSKLFGIDDSYIEVIEKPYGQLEPDLRADSIQALIAFTKSRPKLDLDSTIRKVYFSKKQVDMLTDRMRFLNS